MSASTEAQVDRLYDEAVRCKETAVRLLRARCYELAFRYTAKGSRLAEEAIKLSEYR